MRPGPTPERETTAVRQDTDARGEAGTAAGFQDRVIALLEWLADKDPARAASLIGGYLDDLTEELGTTGPTRAEG